MFVRKKEYEALVREAALSAERERLVQYMIEQIEYLRAQVGAPTANVQYAVNGRPELPFSEEESTPWAGEEEDTLRAMFQAGAITKDEFEKAITGLSTDDGIIE